MILFEIIMIHFLSKIIIPYLFIASTTFASSQSIDVLTLLVKQTLAKEAAQFPTQKITISVFEPDERLKLKKCPLNAIRIDNPYHTSLFETTTMKATCDSETTKWKIYLSVTIDIKQTVYVINKTVAKGTLITQDDIEKKELEVKANRQIYYTTPDKIIGLIAKQPLIQGTILSEQLLEKPVLIHQGDLVTIKAGNNQFFVTMEGTAMMNGHIGEVIRVKNNRSKRMIEGKVTHEKEVAVSS
jgi:flagella basal body P-ring formation protein FlgA